MYSSVSVFHKSETNVCCLYAEYNGFDVINAKLQTMQIIIEISSIMS